MIHGLTHLYLRNREKAPERGNNEFLLEELPTQEHHYQESMKDQCGLGLELSDISEIQQRYWSLPDGAFVEQVDPDSKAYAAGLRTGDLLLQIEDHEILDAASCLEILEKYCGNPSLKLVYHRDGEEHSLEIVLSESYGK